ncbi:MAG: hypothetical protein ACRC2T_12970, partial [Thermoguttaceae bacterium]
TRQQKQITGIVDAGNAETEKFFSSVAPDDPTSYDTAEARAVKDFVETYLINEKLPESAQKHELIPSENREYIQKYFESIRKQK